MSGILLMAAGVSYATVPGAPTIGTATQTGAFTATVAYTAPANNGGAAITSYTATSSPSGGTGTLSQAGSGTISVTGLSESTSYTFTVTATNSVGTSLPSAASNSITTPADVPTVIGQVFGGGFYAGQIATGGGGVATHYLIVSPKATGETVGLKWGVDGFYATGALSTIDGPTNTTYLAGLGAAYQAPTFCENLTIGGYTDWYMPAKDEMSTLYFFLKPTTQTNNTSGGATAYAVSPQPISTNYTSGTPAQTSAAAFQAGGAQEIASANIQYNSTQTFANAGQAKLQFFSDGEQFNLGKEQTNRYVRAVRRVPV